MLKKLFYAIFREPRRAYWREKPLLRQFSGWLPDGITLLDIGAANCKLAELITIKHTIRVVPIDVVDHNATDMDLQLYDGKKLPYNDGQFDAGLLSFVLHHADNPDLLVKEARRVCKRVIIVEDTPVGKLEVLACMFWDRLMNHAHHSDIAVAHETKPASEWRRYFEDRGFHVLHQHSFRTPAPVLWSYRHTVFIVE